MPRAACHVLNSIQSVLGVDLHKQIPPPPPATPQPAPHVVAWCMGLAMPATSKLAPSVMAGGGNALGRQHDLGIGPYHFAPNALLPLVWAGSGNKSEFGAASVLIPSGRLAVAMRPDGLNPQLDCNDWPCAMPTSQCDASLNTVYAGFGMADLVAGYVAMIGDITYALLAKWVVGQARRGLERGIVRMLEGVSDGAGLRAAKIAAAAYPTVAAYIAGGAEVLIGDIVGSPLGYSFNLEFSFADEHVSWTSWGGAANDFVSEWVVRKLQPVSASDATVPAASAGETGSPETSLEPFEREHVWPEPPPLYAPSDSSTAASERPLDPKPPLGTPEGTSESPEGALQPRAPHPSFRFEPSG